MFGGMCVETGASKSLLVTSSWWYKQGGWGAPPLPDKIPFIVHFHTSYSPQGEGGHMERMPLALPGSPPLLLGSGSVDGLRRNETVAAQQPLPQIQSLFLPLQIWHCGFICNEGEGHLQLSSFPDMFQNKEVCVGGRQ